MGRTCSSCRIRSVCCAFVLLMLMGTGSGGGGGVEACTAAESEALLRFGHGIDWLVESYKPWTEGSDCCGWEGVSCSDDKQSVISLNLTGLADLSHSELDDRQDLESILPHLCALHNLQNLDLRKTKLRDYFPACIGNLTALRTLDLSTNFLIGSLPRSISRLSQLQLLDISYNALDGEIFGPSGANSVSSHTDPPSPSFSMDPELLQWKSLQVLKLNSNRFSGSIPSWVATANLPVLKYIDLSDNSFSGPLPSLDNCAKLEKAKLGGNAFEGMIPHSFSSLRSLQFLSLRRNKLTGPLPDLGYDQNLAVLDVTSNQLNGSLPPWLQYLNRRLVVLMLGSNQFEGKLPQWLSSLENLQIFDLSNNKISGTIPPNFLQGYKSTAVSGTSNSGGEHIYGKCLERRIDSDPADSVRRKLIVRDQWYDDDIEFESVAAGSSWTFRNTFQCVSMFDISENAFEGPIPSDLGGFGISLVYLNLSSNLLTGSIPPSIGRIELLYSLDLSFNNLNGTIPSEILSNVALTEFNVSYNKLSGPIPQNPDHDSFKSSSYLGNPDLCSSRGPFRRCGGNSLIKRFIDRLKNWVDVRGLIVGFALGYCGSWASMFLNSKFRRWLLRHKNYEEWKMQLEKAKEQQRCVYGAYVYPE